MKLPHIVAILSRKRTDTFDSESHLDRHRQMLKRKRPKKDQLSDSPIKLPLIMTSLRSRFDFGSGEQETLPTIGLSIETPCRWWGEFCCN